MLLLVPAAAVLVVVDVLDAIAMTMNGCCSSRAVDSGRWYSSWYC